MAIRSIIFLRDACFTGLVSYSERRTCIDPIDDGGGDDDDDDDDNIHRVQYIEINWFNWAMFGRDRQTEFIPQG